MIGGLFVIFSTQYKVRVIERTYLQQVEKWFELANIQVIWARIMSGALICKQRSTFQGNVKSVRISERSSYGGLELSVLY